MIAVDTNVLIRFLTRDGPKQAARAASLMQTEAVWIGRPCCSKPSGYCAAFTASIHKA